MCAFLCLFQPHLSSSHGNRTAHVVEKGVQQLPEQLPLLSELLGSESSNSCRPPPLELPRPRHKPHQNQEPTPPLPTPHARRRPIGADRLRSTADDVTGTSRGADAIIDTPATTTTDPRRRFQESADDLVPVREAAAGQEQKGPRSGTGTGAGGPRPRQRTRAYDVHRGLSISQSGRQAERQTDRRREGREGERDTHASDQKFS